MEPWISFVAEKIALAPFLIIEKIKIGRSKKKEEEGNGSHQSNRKGKNGVCSDG
jgi:hypothetical protein